MITKRDNERVTKQSPEEMLESVKKIRARIEKDGPLDVSTQRC